MELCVVLCINGDYANHTPVNSPGDVTWIVICMF